MGKKGEGGSMPALQIQQQQQPHLPNFFSLLQRSNKNYAYKYSQYSLKSSTFFNYKK